MAKTSLSTGSAYCSPAAFTEIVDWRQAADYVVDSDDDPRPTKDELEASPVLARALLAASGEIEASCLPRGQYTPADLAALTGAAQSHLETLVGILAFWWLIRRRYPASDANTIPASVVDAREQLERLRVGEQVFGTVENTDAGKGMQVLTMRQSTDFNSTVNQARRYFGYRPNHLRGY
jgi:hypothetical protein